MKSKAVILAIALAGLGFSAATLARDDDRRGDRHEQPRAQHVGQHNDHYRAPNRFDNRQNYRAERRAEYRDNLRHDRRDERFDRRNDRHNYYNARRPEFKRGGYIPHDFRSRQYYVTDYRAYRLSPPPRGHQWVQVGPDFVLIAIATGLIANIILNY